METNRSGLPAGVQAVLEICRDIELGCAKLYQALATAHGADPFLKALWTKTSQEEIAHAGQIDFVMRSLKDAVTGTWVDRATTEKKLARIRALTLQMTVRPPAPVEALRLAIELEGEMADVHADSAAAFADASVRKLLKAMQTADNLHLAALQQALRQLLPAG